MAYTESSCHFLAEFSKIENPLFPALESNNNFLRRTRQRVMQFGLHVMSFEDEVYNFCATSSTKNNCKNNEWMNPQTGLKHPNRLPFFRQTGTIVLPQTHTIGWAKQADCNSIWCRYSGEETAPLTLYAFQCNSMLNYINLSRSTALPNHLDYNIIMMAAAQSRENAPV